MLKINFFKLLFKRIEGKIIWREKSEINVTKIFSFIIEVFIGILLLLMVLYFIDLLYDDFFRDSIRKKSKINLENYPQELVENKIEYKESNSKK